MPFLACLIAGANTSSRVSLPKFLCASKSPATVPGIAGALYPYLVLSYISSLKSLGFIFFPLSSKIESIDAFKGDLLL